MVHTMVISNWVGVHTVINLLAKSMRVELSELAQRFKPVELPAAQAHTPSSYRDPPDCPVSVAQLDDIRQRSETTANEINGFSKANEAVLAKWVASKTQQAPGYSGTLLTPQRHS